MESFLSLKHRRKRFFWGLYLCFCCSFVIFCAFYTYSLRTQGNSINSRPVKYDAIDDFVTDGQTTTRSTIAYVTGEIFGISQDRRSVIESTVRKSAYRLSDTIASTTNENTSIFVGTDKHSTYAALKNRTVIEIDESASSNDATFILKTNFTTSLIQIDDEGLPAELTCRSRSVKSKLILLWTPFFGKWDYLPSSAYGRCEECSNCRSTTNRSLLLLSDAVVFHARDMSAADIPAVRLPNQRWIFYCLESPPYSDFPGLEFMQNMFNWTMSYRSDSDVITEYGSFQKVKPTRKLDLSALQESWQWKTKSVVWMSSHCPTQGGRDDYVTQLKKYIDVDEFGKCGRLNCPPDSTEHCMRNFGSNYKFFLAFENSICRDYVTEKFFRTLKYDIVPVVFGGADYRRLAPPGSYVDALAFKSPKHLAYFLTGVGNDFSLYSTYFEWRKDYVVATENRKECALCSMLHKQDGRTSVYPDIRKWWVADGKCRKWSPKV